jgi:hypothetical protein
MDPVLSRQVYDFSAATQGSLTLRAKATKGDADDRVGQSLGVHG